MNEELDSQLSAMFDDELPEAECELLARRLSRDEALKARWRRYAVDGRGRCRAERGVRLETNLAARVSAVISRGAGAGRRSRRRRGRRASAAGVALVAAGGGWRHRRRRRAMSVLWMRAQAPVGGDDARRAECGASRGASRRQHGSADASAPRELRRAANVEPNAASCRTAELANYVVAHSEFSAPLSRRNLLSALVASESGTAGDASRKSRRRSRRDPDDANVSRGPRARMLAIAK